MNMDMLSRGFDILQRAGGMEQISQLMVIVYGVLCVFGLLNCILGYRILRFWMMIFGFIIGAGAGFGVTYMSGVQDKMVIAGAMAVLFPFSCASLSAWDWEYLLCVMRKE